MRVCIVFVAAVLAAVQSVSCSIIRVDVGLVGLTYSPSSIPAEVGDVVKFYFHPKNHSVVQSSFESPCDSSSVTNPFFSGFVPVSYGEAVSTISRY
jgi:plastocyanin